MKKAAGVEEMEAVIERCKTQGQTSSLLEVQNDKAKSEVMRLTNVKEEQVAEWEVVRYLGQSENKDLQEKFIDIELDIEFSNEERKKHEDKIEQIRHVDKHIREALLGITAGESTHKYCKQAGSWRCTAFLGF